MFESKKKESLEFKKSLDEVLESKNKNLEKVKDILNKLLEVNKDFKNLPQKMPDSLIKGCCQECCQVFFVTSRIGDLRCPHCQGDKVLWNWGGLKIAFVPDNS